MQDPVRSFIGREKYKRPLWVTGALDNPSVVRIFCVVFCNLFSASLFVVMKSFLISRALPGADCAGNGDVVN